MKVCKTCGVNRCNSEYHKDRYKDDGLAKSCKVCRNTIKNRHNAGVTENARLLQKWLPVAIHER